MINTSASGGNCNAHSRLNFIRDLFSGKLAAYLARDIFQMIVIKQLSNLYHTRNWNVFQHVMNGAHCSNFLSVRNGLFGNRGIVPTISICVIHPNFD